MLLVMNSWNCGSESRAAKSNDGKFSSLQFCDPEQTYVIAAT